MDRPDPRNPIHDESGAFDLPSIISGVVVVGVLTAGVLASVFGVIPFAQDNSARQDLSAIKTAEGVAKSQHGGYTDKGGLEVLRLVSPLSTDTQVYANSAGFCAVTVSQSGRVFSITSAGTDVVDGNSCATEAAVAGPGSPAVPGAPGDGGAVAVSDPWIITDPALRAEVVKEVTSTATAAPASYVQSLQGGTGFTIVSASYTTSIAPAAIPADITTAGAEYQLTMRDAPKLTHLVASDLGVTTLEGLQYAKNLSFLDVSNNKISDLSPLSGTAALTNLSVAGNQISNLAPLSGKTALTALSVASNPVSALEPLAEDGSLATLDISSTQATNLYPLGSLPLTDLTMNDTTVTDVSMMGGMKTLVDVVANGTAVPDWSPANHVPTVIAPWIIFDDPLRQGISAVQYWPGAQRTIAEARNIEGFNVTPSIRGGAVDFTALKVMTKAWLTYSPDTQDEMSKIRLLPVLRELTLGSGVTDLGDLNFTPATSSIQSIDGFYSSATDLGPLARATSLKKLKVPYLAPDLSPLAGLTNMEDLNLGWIPATDLSPLAGMANLKHLAVNAAAWDFTVLPGLHNLEYVSFAYNSNLKDLGHLAGLSKLIDLNLDYTPIETNWDHTDWSPVANVRYVAYRPANFTMTPAQLASDWVIPDTALRNAILDVLGRPHGASLAYSDAGSVSVLNLPAEVRSLEGLQYAGKLDHLDISLTSVTDLSPLKDLPLRGLSVNGANISDWSPVAYLPNVAGRP